MTRRNFFRSALAALAALPFAGKLFAEDKKKFEVIGTVNPFDYSLKARGGVVATRPGCKIRFILPEETGEFYRLTMVNGILVMACENGIWISERPFNGCRKLDTNLAKDARILWSETQDPTKFSA